MTTVPKLKTIISRNMLKRAALSTNKDNTRTPKKIVANSYRISKDYLDSLNFEEDTSSVEFINFVREKTEENFLTLIRTNIPIEYIYSLVEKHNILDLENIRNNICRLAILANRVDVLELAHNQIPPCPWDEKTTLFAISVDAVECLKYAHENGCALHTNALSRAACINSLNCLRYLCETNVKRIGNTRTFINSNSKDCLRFLLSTHKIILPEPLDRGNNPNLECSIIIKKHRLLFPFIETFRDGYNSIIDNNSSSLERIPDNGFDERVVLKDNIEVQTIIAPNHDVRISNDNRLLIEGNLTELNTNIVYNLARDIATNTLVQFKNGFNEAITDYSSSIRPIVSLNDERIKLSGYTVFNLEDIAFDLGYKRVEDMLNEVETQTGGTINNIANVPNNIILGLITLVASIFGTVYV